MSNVIAYFRTKNYLDFIKEAFTLRIVTDVKIQYAFDENGVEDFVLLMISESPEKLKEKVLSYPDSTIYTGGVKPQPEANRRRR